MRSAFNLHSMNIETMPNKRSPFLEGSKGYHAPYQGFNPAARGGAGYFIGTGIVAPKTWARTSFSFSSFPCCSCSSSCPSDEEEAASTGTRTPHSQLRQLSFGSFLVRSWTILPLLFLFVSMFVFREGSGRGLTMHSQTGLRCPRTPIRHSWSRRGA
jgi:hypothetical protein